MKAPRHNGRLVASVRKRSTRGSRRCLSFLILLSLSAARPAVAAKCRFISSYHQGYAWSDSVERGVRSVLNGQCELLQFDMDTKRLKKGKKVY